MRRNSERKWQKRADPVLAMLILTCTPLTETLIGAGEDVKANHCNVEASRVRSQEKKNNKKTHSNYSANGVLVCRSVRRTNWVAEATFIVSSSAF